MSTPMKIPRTMNEQYKIIRAEEEEQRRRKTSVKRATVSPSVCRSIMGAHPTPLPTGDATLSSASPSMTPHALPVESLNSTFSS